MVNCGGKALISLYNLFWTSKQLCLLCGDPRNLCANARIRLLASHSFRSNLDLIGDLTLGGDFTLRGDFMLHVEPLITFLLHFFHALRTHFYSKSRVARKPFGNSYGDLLNSLSTPKIRRYLYLMHWSNFHDFCDFLHDIGLWIPFLLTVFSFRVNIFIDYLAHLRNKMHMPMHMHFISHKWGSRKQKWKSRHDCHQCRGCNLHLYLDLQYINFSVIKPSCIFYFTMTVNHPFLLFRGGRKVAIISLTSQIRSSKTSNIY